MGVVKMSDLPVKTQEPKPIKNKVLTMSQIKDPAMVIQRKRLYNPNRKIWDVLKDGMWKGERCFIIGGGQSAKGLNYKLLENERVIAVNMAFRLLEPDIIFAYDARLWGWIELNEAASGDKEKFDKSKAVKIWSDIISAPLPEDIVVAPSIGRPGLSKTLKEGIGAGTNSGFGALNIALLLGASEIYLIGFDFYGKRWHKGYPHPASDSSDHKYHLECYSQSALEFKEFDSKIINVNPESQLKIFEFGELPKDLGKVKKKPLVPPKEPVKLKKGQVEPVFVSFYTENGQYKEYAQILKRTSEQFGLKHDIQAIKNKGNWMQNTKFKPEFLEKMCERYPGQPVVWIDCDASFIDYPKVLFEMKTDIAFHMWEEKQPASGVVFLANNEMSKAFLSEWKRLCGLKKNLKKTDQDLMYEAAKDFNLEGKALHIGHLPVEYCYIVGLMKDNSVQPVIEHMQASRKNFT